MSETPTPTRILVADDEDSLLLLVRRILEGAGYRVETARDGREALAAIDAGPPDLLLLDIMMPVLDGWQVLAELRTRAARPPVLVLSAAPEPERALREGAVAFLRKPFRRQELVAACQQALARR